jgi:hypothetical protein
MSEVTKLYDNAGIEPICRFKGLVNGTCFYFAKPCQEEDCKKFSAFVKEFTAEKQIELVCFLINRGVELSFNCEQGKINTQVIQRGLAGLINNLWKDLTEEEKQQVKEILE